MQVIGPCTFVMLGAYGENILTEYMTRALKTRCPTYK